MVGSVHILQPVRPVAYRPAGGSRAMVAAMLAAMLALPSDGAGAQSRFELSPFASRNESFAGSSAADAERGWVADADAVISPAHFPVIGPLLGGFLPTVFSGVGVEGLRRTDGAGGQSVVTSYGVGVSRTLGGFAFETEARRRIPVTLGGAAAEENPITTR